MKWTLWSLSTCVCIKDVKDTDTYRKTDRALGVTAASTETTDMNNILLVKRHKFDQEVNNKFLANFVSWSSCCALYCLFM